MKNKLISIIKQAGKIMLENQDANIHTKEGHYNYVTDADFKVQSFLANELKLLLPESLFFAEEKKNDELTDVPTWIVDPIDGTINFMRNRKYSCISIALMKAKKPVIGLVYNPYKNELFYAEKGKGAFLNEIQLKSSNEKLDNSIINLEAASANPFKEQFSRLIELLMGKAGDIRITGSAAIDICEVALGIADASFAIRLSPWDYAAACLIANEAGANIACLENIEVDYSKSQSIVVGNKTLFNDFFKAITDTIRI